MSFHDLVTSKELRKEGKRLGRRGLSQRVIKLVKEFDKEPSYKGAMELSGRIKALVIAAKYDEYWTEHVNQGFRKELWDIKSLGEEKDDTKFFDDLKKSEAL